MSCARQLQTWPFGDAHPLHLRLATQRLKDEGNHHTVPERLLRIVRSIAADGRGEGGSGGSIAIRRWDKDTVKVTLQREWEALNRIARLRRTAARRVLDHLLAALPPRSRGADLLAETTLGKLLTAIRSDLQLGSEVRNFSKHLDHALLWLHEHQPKQSGKPGEHHHLT